MFSSNQEIPLIKGFLALLLWSSAAVLVCQLASLPPFEVMGIACGLAALTQLGRCRAQSQTHWIPIVLFCLTEIGYVLAFRFAPPVEVDLINYLWPLFVLFGVAFLHNERFRPQNVLAALIGLSGVMVLALDKTIAPTLENWIGYALALVGALAWTGYTLYARLHPNQRTDVAACYAVCAIASWILHFAFEEFALPSSYDWIHLLAYGAGVVGLSYRLWDGGIKSRHLQMLTVSSYLIPVVSVALLILTGYASMNRIVVAATCLVGSAGFMSNLTR